MQMGPKEIAVEYRTAANRQKQIKVLAELNQCPVRRIAEILAAEGEELPKIYQELLRKPGKRSRKFPEAETAEREEAVATRGEPGPEAAAEPPVSPAERATDADIFHAVASLLPEASREETGPEPVPVAPRNADEAWHWVDGVGPEAPEAAEPAPMAAEAPEAADAGDVLHGEVSEASLITREDVCLGACKNLIAALDLKPDEFHCYACGALDLVFSLIGVPMVWQPIHDNERS